MHTTHALHTTSMMRPLRYVAALSLAILAGSAGARAEPDLEDAAGRVLGTVAGQQIELPMLRSDYAVDIVGDLATVRVTQVFANPSTGAMSAEYLFPLNQAAAVFAMEMQVGGETIAAQIQTKSEAEVTFKAAEAEGKSAALLTQHRPNMFTQNIANLMPGQPVTVTLSYVQAVPRIDGAYELVVPLVVGPRYQGATQDATPSVDNPLDADMVASLPATDPSAAGLQSGGWAVAPLPAYPSVYGLDLPDEIAPDRVTLDLTLAAPVEIRSLTSATHALRQSSSDETGLVSAQFEAGQVIDNRDLVVRYGLGGDETTAGLLAHSDARGGFVSLLIEPPQAVDPTQAIPREIVFVLDTSGSMSGAPIEASKRFMQAALQGLRPGDYFRILPFSNRTRQFARDAVPATQANMSRALAYVRGLNAGGGTEIDAAIRTAFDTAQPVKTLRLVVFLSDGYIGDEAAVLTRLRQQIGAARVYAFGIGTSVNRYLLDAMAKEGRGYARYIDPTETAFEAAEALARDLRTPLLTNISIDWGGLDVTEMTPARLPDLFDGNSLRVLARYEAGGTGQVRINGMVGGRMASLTVDADLPQAAQASGSPAIPWFGRAPGLPITRATWPPGSAIPPCWNVRSPSSA